VRHAGGEENCRNGGKVPTLRYAEDGAPGKSKAKAWATCLLVPTCPVTALIRTWASDRRHRRTPFLDNFRFADHPTRKAGSVLI
jgi:hypothetical protein